ncbi:Spo0B domain-containing protein [Gottschalkia acidurici]|uniref:Spo0B domain-containing protein n=1 Tax=Clostridium acidurici TaxID=1556 RepID=UPI00059FF576|nr:Spo0B domain-containing protein [Gottschalkia acidurici]
MLIKKLINLRKLLILNLLQGCEKYLKNLELLNIKDLKNLSRNQRHDYMNIFQIIYGYLQLNRKEDAIDQIKKVTSMTQNISKLYSISIFSMVLLLERKIMQANNLGINLNIEVETESNSEFRAIDNEEELLEKTREIIDCLLYQHSEDQELTINMKIIENIDSIEITILTNSQYYNLDEVKYIENLYDEAKVHNNKIIITLKYEGVKNIQIKESIYSKIYSNTI